MSATVRVSRLSWERVRVRQKNLMRERVREIQAGGDRQREEERKDRYTEE